MDFRDYQDATSATAVYPHSHDISAFMPDRTMDVHSAALSYLALGLGEAGEVQGKIKKLIRDGDAYDDKTGYVTMTPEQRDAILAEMGDLLWYVAQLATALDGSLNSIARANLAKLKSRKERGVLQGSGDER